MVLFSPWGIFVIPPPIVAVYCSHRLTRYHRCRGRSTALTNRDCYCHQGCQPGFQPSVIDHWSPGSPPLSSTPSPFFPRTLSNRGGFVCGPVRSSPSQHTPPRLCPHNCPPLRKSDRQLYPHPKEARGGTNGREERSRHQTRFAQIPHYSVWWPARPPRTRRGTRDRNGGWRWCRFYRLERRQAPGRPGVIVLHQTNTRFIIPLLHPTKC